MFNKQPQNEHRKIGKQLNLFDLSSASAGMVNWYPKGYELYQKIEQFIRQQQNAHGYKEVKSPIMANSNLWQQSGHLDKYHDDMFMFENDKQQVAIKPMSCPFHIQMFQSLVQSYQQLPLRLAEFGLCHRNEASGALNGLLRLRSFNQDDGHIFCRRPHIEQELIDFVELLFAIYERFGFNKSSIKVKISLRPLQSAGNDEHWQEAELALQNALNKQGLAYDLLPGEGAFYGPKVEFSLQDSLKREWQCGTFQLDFILAERMNAHFINEQGNKEHPVILHRAVLGSLERFIAILIEHHQGKLPLWLNPNAISILPVNADHQAYAQQVKQQLSNRGINISINSNNDSISYRLRQHFKQKGLYCLIIGDDEQQQSLITVRDKKSNRQMSVEQFVEQVIQ